MKKKVLISIFTIVLVLLSFNSSLCIDKEKEYCKDIMINNINPNDIRIEVLDIDIKEEKIVVSDEYDAYAIITMNITNESLSDVELSNINIYPSQGDVPTKYFVSTSKDNITGFIGNLASEETKEIKMGVTLHNTKEPINLEIINLEDQSNEKITESINIK